MIKTDLTFYKKDNMIYFYCLNAIQQNSNEQKYILQDTTYNEKCIILTKDELSEYKLLSSEEMYFETHQMDDKRYREFISSIGIYRCPFCGGRLQWSSDFMTSEIRGLEDGYKKIIKEDTLDYIKSNEDSLMKSGMLSTTDNIEEENNQIIKNGTYRYTYLKCVDENNITTYYGVDDPVIGIYSCGSCGKNYEIQDPYEFSDEI